jgi:hypothetical protein
MALLKALHFLNLDEKSKDYRNAKIDVKQCKNELKF